MNSTNLKLFKPIRVGDITLAHRVVLAPLTRYRANHAHVHGDLAVKYYSQRASTPGTLLITEATFIALRAGGEENVPGIWNDEQIAAWRQVTDAVHAQGSFIFLQLWALGRAAIPDVLEQEGGISYVSASDVQLQNKPCPPRPLTVEEIREYVTLFAQAATNAVHHAGFDGVEVHGANGYLVDQFTQNVSNRRTDEYGGSIENRCRFALEIVEAVVKAVGEQKVGIRLSPWSKFNDMRMDDPRPTFSYLVSQLAERFPSMAYIHVIESRVHGPTDGQPEKDESNDFLRTIWIHDASTPRAYIAAGGFTRDSAIATTESAWPGAQKELVAFGRKFIANPDLPRRLKDNLPLTEGNRDTYYKIESPEGYIDYPFADENV